MDTGYDKDGVQSLSIPGAKVKTVTRPEMRTSRANGPGQDGFVFFRDLKIRRICESVSEGDNRTKVLEPR